jgi:hypothetical protein
MRLSDEALTVTVKAVDVHRAALLRRLERLDLSDELRHQAADEIAALTEAGHLLKSEQDSRVAAA